MPKLKNLVYASAALLFAAGVLMTSVVRTTAQTSPKLKVAPLAKVTPSPTATPTPTKVEYYLAYPGILPDHFLYSIKMARDKLWLFFTRDPLKRAELLLLFADKRLGAGRALVEGGKTELGMTTITKGEKYLEQAVLQAKATQKAGKDTNALYEKLTRATLKHVEVLNEIQLRVSDEVKPTLETIKKYPLQGYETVIREKGE